MSDLIHSFLCVTACILSCTYVLTHTVQTDLVLAYSQRYVLKLKLPIHLIIWLTQTGWLSCMYDIVTY